MARDLRRFWGVRWFVIRASLAFLVIAGCGSAAPISPEGGTQAASTQSQCKHAAGVDDVSPGACAVGSAYLVCNFASGAGCLCVTDAQSCDGCGSGSGATCQDQCKAGEYALSCGGPPSSIAYASPPTACRGIGSTPAGNTYYCCPCL
jgi:hypothetical protein